MEIKTLLIAFSIITTLVSFAYPSLAAREGGVDDEPLVHSDREMDAVEAISPASQDYNYNMLENLPFKYLTYLSNCIDKMGDGFKKCNNDVIKEILMKKPVVSRRCCLKIVQAGKQCYVEIRKVMFRYYQLKRFASQVSSETQDVWNRCSAQVQIPQPLHHD
ncbi:hypothetical protein EUTSA_v10005636mg [Eutrema salsugineum]|uniref:Prolamin-like domain-containing protein n=1 Tax=Eutrema salsugineum TaxID=72664 RepID=V4MLE2_EUTSA|nr:hypothetical protein EUTSA_v10005636mg [Eutrema salsugineum]